MKFLCYFFKHKMHLFEKVRSVEKHQCKRCKQFFGYCYWLDMYVPWDFNLEVIFNSYKRRAIELSKLNKALKYPGALQNPSGVIKTNGVN